MKLNCMNIFSLSLAILTFCGCSKEDEEKIILRDWSTEPPSAEIIANTNKIRKEHGVRLIKDDWTFYGRDSGKEIWYDKNDNSCKNVYWNRSYQYIRRETDKYNTGVTFPSPDFDGGTMWEKLNITYHYGPKCFTLGVITNNKEIENMVSELKSRIRYPDKYGSYTNWGSMGKTNKETLEVADRILKMWGLERL